MQTFDKALFEHYAQGEISYENAIAHADSKNDLCLMIKMQSDEVGGEQAGEKTMGIDSLTIEDDSSDKLRW